MACAARIWFCMVFLFATGAPLQAQPGSILFVPRWKQEPLKADTSYTIDGTQETITVSRFRMYIGNISAWNHGKCVFRDSSYHLLDLEYAESMQVVTGISGKYDEIRFVAGTDSVTNVSGALGGDLDPTKGMYWTWNSGYINLKLEGTCSLSQERGHGYQFHIGGYLPPYQTVREVSLTLPKHWNHTIILDLSRLITVDELRNSPMMMTPGAAAVRLSKRIPSMFMIP